MFLISGFCGLVYQVVWLRLAFAEFGIITPVVSVLVSVFMLGLFLGSWAAGYWGRGWTGRSKLSPLVAYGISEILIGVSAFAVPVLFRRFSDNLLGMGDMDSRAYLVSSGSLIMVAILPWCFFMGTTFPLAVAYVKSRSRGETASFSYLYLANVIGAMCGTALTAYVLVESLGFQKTLFVAAGGNFLIGAMALVLGLRDKSATPAVEKASATNAQGAPLGQGFVYAVLFATGFASMGMEVAWTRAFTPITQTTVYAFAFLLTTYLAATWVGSFSYRRRLHRGGEGWSVATLVAAVAVTSVLPLLLNDPRLRPKNLNIFLSLFPTCALMGYLTPLLIDRYSQGVAEKVGKAYAVNVLGCILGPLAAGYLLLPTLGVKMTLLLLSVPLFLCAAAGWTSQKKRLPASWIAASVVAILAATFAQTYEDRPQDSGDVVRRDHTATVISTGTGMNKHLLVNGIGITVLTPVTKVMAHLPLAALPNPPQSALVICFGMGTSFRSLVSWGIDTTAVELVPSVVDAFDFYFADADEVRAKPNAHVVVDDGRRFLKRSTKTFDVITLDPPPPVEAAGSSLLYSRQFYDLVKARLTPQGILQQWFPGGERKILNSVARALVDAFPYVRVYRSMEGWGYHFLASQQPIPDLKATELAAKLPPDAKADLLEWFPGMTAEQVFDGTVTKELALNETLDSANSVPMMSDDRPFNEYYWIRRKVAKREGGVVNAP